MSGDALNDLALLIKSVELSGAVRQMAVRKHPTEPALLTLDEVYLCILADRIADKLISF